MNSPGMKARTGGSGLRGPAQPLNIAIPNSMSYRNAAPPQLSPTDDDLSTPKKPQYYRPPGSPESPEVPQAFFNYNYDRIQNDLLDEICDEIGIKDATDLDFMDFEPPGVGEEFNPAVVGDEIDNLDQLIMFGQIDPQQGQESQYGQEGMGKWTDNVDQSVPESSSSMPNNSPVYGNSPAKPSKGQDPQGQCQASEGYTQGQRQGQSGGGSYAAGDVAQSCASPARRNSATSNTWQQNSSVPGQGSQPSYDYDEVPASQAHMTDDYKIASPRKNSTDGSSACVPQGPPSSHHDSMLKMAIAQDRMLGHRTGSTSVGSPASLEASSPASQMPLSPGYQVPSPTTPSKAGPQQCKHEKVNQTDSSKGLDQFAAPENLPPGKERAMSRMKLTDGPNSGKRSPFDQGYFSVGSGGSHYEDHDLSSATPPHCPDQPAPPSGDDKTLDFLSDMKDRRQGPLTDDALLSLAQGRVKQEQGLPQPDSQGPVSSVQRQMPPNPAMASQARMSSMRQGEGLSQPPRSPNIARREIHRAVLPSSTVASKPGIFQRQNSNNQGISFEPPPGGYKAPEYACSVPNQGQGYPPSGMPQGQGQNMYNVPVAQPAMAASANCAPYPRSCRPEDMAYGAKRSGSNPSSPKKQRRLTYNPYQGDNSVGFNNPGQYNNPNMAGRPANSGQYGLQSQMGGNGSMPQPLASSGQPGQMMPMQQRGNYGMHPQPGMQQQQQHQMGPGAHGAGAGTALPMSSQSGYQQGQYNQHPQGQYNNQGQGHMRQGQGQHQGHMGQGQGHMGQGQGHMGQNQGHMMQNSGYQQHPQQQRQQQQPGQMMYGQQQQQQQQSISPAPQSSGGFDLDSSFEENTAYQQQSLGALIAGHPEASKYGFMQQLVSDRSNAFRSHPLFPLLRDLIVADMNFSTPTFPFQLIANLPTDFDKLLSNYFQRNPPTAKYEANKAVENVVIDALRYAHKSLIEKITERKQKAGIAEQPKMFSAIEDFCERFDQAVKHTMSRNSTPKASMPAPQQPQQNVQPKMEPPSQQPLPPHQMAAPGGMGVPHQPTVIQPMSTPGGALNPGNPGGHMPGPQAHPHQHGQYTGMNPGYHGNTHPSSNGPHGNMAPAGGIMDGQQQQLRSISPFDQTSASALLSRQASYPQTSSSQWPPGRGGYGPPGHASSLPSTPTKSGYGNRGGMYPQHRPSGGSSSSIHLSDVDLTASHLAEQQKLGYGTGSMPNFINSSGISNRLAAGTPPLGQSPYKGGRAGSPGVDIQRAGSEPALNCMKTYGSPQRGTTYVKDNRNNNNNNNNSSGSNNNGSRKQVLPKEAVAIMLDWLREHRDNPYPNDDEKYMLIQQTKLTMAQINYWFTNARRRILPKWTLQRLMEEQARATGRELTPEQQKEILSTKLTPQAVRNILEGQSVKKSMSDISYGHIMNSVINQS